MTIDEKLNKLGEIEEKMSSTDITVSESVELFESASALAKEILAELKDTKGKVSVIKKDLDAYFEETVDDEDVGK